MNLRLENNISIVNSGDIDPTIGINALIDNDQIGSVSTATVTLTNTGVIGGDLTQAANIGQANTIASSIAIDNSGGIVASDGGILAEIDNTYISLANAATVSVANSNAVYGGHTQSADIDQANTLSNGITIGNSGGIVAGYTGIGAEIDNINIYLQNVASVSLTSPGLVFGGRTQSLDLGQANTIASDISIVNSGGIDPDVGLTAKIDNDLISSVSTATISITNGSAVGLDLTQSANIDQASTITSGIAIDNSGGVVAGYAGIGAEIDSASISLGNSASTDFVRSGLVVGDLTQSADIGQANTIASDISIVNSGGIDPVIGIGALIDNGPGPIGLTNSAYANPLSNGGSLISGDRAQSADIGQANLIANGIAIDNSGVIDAGYIGIGAEIDNAYITLTNGASASLKTYNIVLGDLGQYANLDQTSAITNSIAIGNSGGIGAGYAGISAEIGNTDISISNSDTTPLFNVATTSGDLTQSLVIGQANTIANDISIVNSGDIDPDMGIRAGIGNGNGPISLTNAAYTTLVDSGNVGGDLTQSADIDQANALASSIAIGNSGGIVASDGGILTDIMNSYISLGNYAAPTLKSAVPLGGDLKQYANLDQANTIASDIAIVNSGDIDAGHTGIGALIDNANISYANYSRNGAVIRLTSYNGPLGDHLASANIVQASTIASGIDIENSGTILADYAGIGAEIDNTDMTLMSYASAVLYADDSGVDVIPQPVDIGQTYAIGSGIAIVNSGDIVSGIGIGAEIDNTYISLTNQANADIAFGSKSQGAQFTQSAAIDQANTTASDITIMNSGDINAGAFDISATAVNQNMSLLNEGGAKLLNGAPVDLGQYANIDQSNTIASSIAIEKRGDVESDGDAISALIDNGSVGLSDDAGTSIINGQQTYSVLYGEFTLSAYTAQTNTVESGIAINNSGGVMAGDAGIRAAINNDTINFAATEGSSLASNDIIQGDLTQSADIGQTSRIASIISIVNSDDVSASVFGIRATILNQYITFQNGSYLDVGNNAPVDGDFVQSVDANQTNTITNGIAIENRADVESDEVAISALIGNQNIGFVNYANASVTNTSYATGSTAQTLNLNQTNRIESHITILNSGIVRGHTLGIYAGIPDPVYTATNTAIPYTSPGVAISLNQSTVIDSDILIVNSGLITADSLFAIDTYGASTTILNQSGGLITGLVDLTDKSDLFDNQAGGTFEARLTSDFGGGDDLFKNAGTVHTAADASAAETTAFVGLERFENRGRITMQDGHEGDSFEISNTVGGRDLKFAGSGNSTLAVDAFLGPPGSTSDTFTINGDVSGKTVVTVHNTNPGPGAVNTVGIPVVFVNGNVKGDEFFLPQPIDAGFVDYDLFFRPTGSGVFELKSFLAPGVFVPPQLITAAQDVFFTTEETWFDRSTDLRVLLNGGVPLGHDPNAKHAAGAPQGPASFTPAVWVRGSGTWLNREDSATSTAFGRTFQFDLSRNLEVMDFETGVDFGKRDFLSSGDILVFGALGGVVHADLDYDHIDRQFEFTGGEIGAYATYLNGGLFVDTLAKAQFLEVEPQTVPGFPSSLDATTFGVRTDTGYRFGGFRGGPFIEPLATIAVAWADLDGFTQEGNTVSFGDDPSVRGRLGLRVGTSREAWRGIVMEPFVIGSVWANLSGDNEASLTSSTGTTLRFKDGPDDVWGVASAGVNFFNPSANTSVFAKLDVIFGEEIDGISARAGMRYNW